MQQPQPINNNYNPQPSFNQNYMQQPMPNPEDITDPTTAMNMALALMAKAFKLNYSTPTNNNQRISSNPRNRQIAQPGITNQNPNGNGNVVAARAEGNATGNNVRPRRRDAAYLQTQLLIAQKEEAKIQLQAEEYDLMSVVADIDEIEEVNANCILMANLQQASTSGTQTDKAPIYDSDGSAENDSDVITAAPSVEQSGGIVEQHSATVEEIHAYYQSLYKNLAVEVKKVNMVNRNMKVTNAELTTELARCSAKQTTTLNEEITNLNTQLSNEKSTISFLQEERKKFKSYFKKREDELLDKQILLENKIKGLENIRNRSLMK
ncbi:hypothetical protein Tco_1312844 [Tanacetum coccineum]